MNTPDETITSGWSAEIRWRESWRCVGGTFDNWWEAGMALIKEECDDRRLEARELKIEDRSHDDEIVPDNVEIDVGIFHDPEPPERAVDAYCILDAPRDDWHEDYEVEPAEDWLSGVTKEQKDDLTEMVRAAVAGWLGRHKLNPMWKVVSRSWTVTAGQIRAKAKEMRLK